ncbi:MAG: DUF177 domain-containing protein [Bryobacterales bacterium]|nr:DUF177 domain-containing protein [Bryobacteraceae bacterium]MDW8355053.1 DUF177 domain-containing protein [Bryobacterales bacterium]
MFLSVREMELRKVRFHETFPPGQIEFFDAKLWQASLLEASGSAELIPNSGGEIRVRGRLTVCMQAECDRCLEPASFPLDLAFDLFYEPLTSSPRVEEVELSESDCEVAFYQGEGLELEDVLREQILLALPMRRICREDCKGICPQCGQNRNLAPCACRPQAVDDRWAALRDL